MFVSPKSYCNSQFYKRVWLTLMFVSPKPSGELRAFSNILSDAEDSEDVYSCIMMRKEASVLLSSLVGMIKIYLSVSCLLTVCCARKSGFVYLLRLVSSFFFLLCLKFCAGS